MGKIQRLLLSCLRSIYFARFLKNFKRDDFNVKKYYFKLQRTLKSLTEKPQKLIFETYCEFFIFGTKKGFFSTEK
jgi:hypothetical protein